MTDDRTDETRYFDACHQMQTAVAIEITRDPAIGSPKDVRVGVNSALASIGALAGLLISKGVFTMEEYTKANADAMEREVQMHRELLGLDDSIHLA